MKSVFVINEGSVFALLAAALVRSPAYLLEVAPVFRFTGPLLERICSWLERKGRLQPMTALCPEFAPFVEYKYRTLLYDVFGRNRPWMERHFGFDAAETAGADYAFGYRLTICNYLGQYEHLIHACRMLSSRDDAATIQVIGLGADIAAGAGNSVDDGSTGGLRIRIRRPMVPARFVNLLSAIGVGLQGAVWVLTRARPRLPKPTEFFCAFDYVADENTALIYREIDDGGPILLVARDRRAVVGALPGDSVRHTLIHTMDGQFAPLEAARAAGRVIADCARIYRRFGGCEAPLFYTLIGMPIWPAIYRALFNLYRPRVFWGRDSYNASHVLRRREVHRFGGQSWSVLNTFPAYSIIYPSYWYTSYDRHYVLGCAVFDRYYQETWASDMEVVVAGPYRASREAYASRALPKPADILVLCACFIGEPGMVDLIRSLATAFPDRKVILQLRRNRTYSTNDTADQFIADCTKGLANVEVTRERVYDLFPRARYAFSDPSSAVVEAVQFGLYAFFADVAQVQETSYLRDVEGLPVTSGEEAVRRIRAIENGTWHYPIETLARHLDLSGYTFFDRIRIDLGLAPKEPPLTVWQDLEPKTAAG